MKFRNGFVSNSSSEAFICGYWTSAEFTLEEITTFLQKALDFYNEIEDRNLSFEEVFETPKLGTAEDLDLLRGWEKKLTKETVEGIPIIYSAESNSIPYLLFGFIETKFSAKRMHLG